MSPICTHFAFEEFWSRSEAGGPRDTPVPPELEGNLHRLVISTLEPIRVAHGGPIKVVSGYRSPAYNRLVGGAKNSQHMLAKAADIRPHHGSVDDLAALVESMISRRHLPLLGGLGLYRGWIHVDIRPLADGQAIVRWGE